MLEASGLREGYEYQTQVSIETDNRSRMQPDVIVRLPQGKDVVIDARLTPGRLRALFQRRGRLHPRSRCRNLTLPRCVTIFACWDARDYQQLPGLRSLDYVLMFIPVEPAFCWPSIASLSSSARRCKIICMLVSPTTLLVALRTIANLWRYEHQSRNAQKIAGAGGAPLRQNAPVCG
ncbi:DNA recombination protein RmuC [Klebsiella pneumoniae subsp. pneumoniae]|nr:DNA recombination protein RmuC [Klebsiella pneumoniae subsp. pneumoniae]